MTDLSADQLSELETDLLDLQEQVLGISELFGQSEALNHQSQPHSPIVSRQGQSCSEQQAMQLIEIERALNRLDDQSYGYCSVCQQSIGFDLLKSQPLTEKCFSCR